MAGKDKRGRGAQIRIAKTRSRGTPIDAKNGPNACNRFTVAVNQCKQRAKVSTLCKPNCPAPSVPHPVVCVGEDQPRPVNRRLQLTMLSDGVRPAPASPELSSRHAQ